MQNFAEALISSHGNNKLANQLFASNSSMFAEDAETYKHLRTALAEELTTANPTAGRLTIRVLQSLGRSGFDQDSLDSIDRIHRKLLVLMAQPKKHKTTGHSSQPTSAATNPTITSNSSNTNKKDKQQKKKKPTSNTKLTTTANSNTSHSSQSTSQIATPSAEVDKRYWESMKDALQYMHMDKEHMPGLQALTKALDQFQQSITQPYFNRFTAELQKFMDYLFSYHRKIEVHDDPRGFMESMVGKRVHSYEFPQILLQTLLENSDKTFLSLCPFLDAIAMMHLTTYPHLEPISLPDLFNANAELKKGMAQISIIIPLRELYDFTQVITDPNTTITILSHSNPVALQNAKQSQELAIYHLCSGIEKCIPHSLRSEYPYKLVSWRQFDVLQAMLSSGRSSGYRTLLLDNLLAIKQDLQQLGFFLQKAVLYEQSKFGNLTNAKALYEIPTPDLKHINKVTSMYEDLEHMKEMEQALSILDNIDKDTVTNRLAILRILTVLGESSKNLSPSKKPALSIFLGIKKLRDLITHPKPVLRLTEIIAEPNTLLELKQDLAKLRPIVQDIATALAAGKLDHDVGNLLDNSLFPKLTALRFRLDKVKFNDNLTSQLLASLPTVDIIDTSVQKRTIAAILRQRAPLPKTSAEFLELARKSGAFSVLSMKTLDRVYAKLKQQILMKRQLEELEAERQLLLTKMAGITSENAQKNPDQYRTMEIEAIGRYLSKFGRNIKGTATADQQTVLTSPAITLQDIFQILEEQRQKTLFGDKELDSIIEQIPDTIDLIPHKLRLKEVLYKGDTTPGAEDLGKALGAFPDMPEEDRTLWEGARRLGTQPNNEGWTQWLNEKFPDAANDRAKQYKKLLQDAYTDMAKPPIFKVVHHTLPMLYELAYERISKVCRCIADFSYVIAESLGTTTLTGHHDDFIKSTPLRLACEYLLNAPAANIKKLCNSLVKLKNPLDVRSYSIFLQHPFDTLLKSLQHYLHVRNDKFHLGDVLNRNMRTMWMSAEYLFNFVQHITEGQLFAGRNVVTERALNFPQGTSFNILQQDNRFLLNEAAYMEKQGLDRANALNTAMQHQTEFQNIVKNVMNWSWMVRQKSLLNELKVCQVIVVEELQKLWRQHLESLGLREFLRAETALYCSYIEHSAELAAPSAAARSALIVMKLRGDEPSVAKVIFPAIFRDNITKAIGD